MSIDSAIRRARRRERQVWRSEGTLTRPGAGSSFNATTGNETPAAPTTIYEGDLDVRPADTRGRDAQAGEREIRIGVHRGKFPPTVVAKVDDVLEVTSSKYDAALVGRTFRVTDVERNDWKVATAVMLEEVTP